MAKLKLTYFDFHGGRGEPARLALSIAGIAFEDDRVAPADWERRKAEHRLALCLCSKWMRKRLRSRMPSIATWVSSRISIRPTRGRPAWRRTTKPCSKHRVLAVAAPLPRSKAPSCSDMLYMRIGVRSELEREVKLS